MKRREFIRTAAAAGATTALVPTERALAGTVPPRGGAVDEADGISRRAAHPEEGIRLAADAPIDVRIRFGGLCVYVPDPDGRSIHVLMPETGPQHPHHVPRVYYRRDGEGKKRSFVPGESLLIGGWTADAPRLPLQIFDMAKYPANCVGTYGKVDHDMVHPAARIRVYGGSGEVVNLGGRWLLPGDSPEVNHGMPTIIDWWWCGAPQATVATELIEWGLIADPGQLGSLIHTYGNHPRPVVDLWVVNTLEGEDPSVMTSKPRSPTTNINYHFDAYRSLFKCFEIAGLPLFLRLEDELEERLRPYWPDGHSFIGMLVDCGGNRGSAL